MEETFGARVRRLRLERVLTQTELAELAGVTRGAIARIESGDRGTAPRPKTIRDLAHALGVDPRWLRDGAPAEDEA